MPLRYGKCTNFGLCVKADTREAQSIPDGADFVCQECKRPLTAIFAGAKESSRVPIPIVMGVLVVLLLLGGGAYYFVTHRGSPETANNKPVTPPAASGPAAAPLLRLSGSNTIGSELAPALASAWLSSRGVTNVHSETIAPDETHVSGTKDGAPVTIEIKAHGSATAFTALGAGTCDIGMASRKIKPQEASDLSAKGLGDLTSNANERVLGLDGVAVVVNESNGIDTMSILQVAAAFSGEAFSGQSSGTKWNIYARDDKSGTYDTFKDRVLGTRSLAATAKRFEDSKALVSAVAQDHNGIGFVGLPYASGAKVLAISEKGAIPLVPNVNTVRTESYPLSRRLYLYVPDNAKPEAREFARFALSEAGQDIVDKTGFIGQKVGIMSNGKAPANSPAGYLQLMPSADRLTVDFRFRTGSSQLDTKSVDDIKRVASTLSNEYSGRGLMLVGFADSTGAPAKNLELSKQRAQSVADQMKQQGITPAFVTGFGQELPVADNGTPDGRDKNRRVEVWLRK